MIRIQKQKTCSLLPFLNIISPPFLKAAGQYQIYNGATTNKSPFILKSRHSNLENKVMMIYAV
jgi:hypothetical protein